MARARKRKRIATRRRLHQEPIVRQVAKLLDTGTPTKFRYSSAARHGLRAAMCLKGEKWARADAMAGEIVALALARIGATIPTWRVAQGDPPQEREYWFCASCGGFMKANSKPWCSPECCATLHSRQRNSTKREDDEARQRAIRVILTGGPQQSTHWQRGLRRCPQCSELYEPCKVTQRHCSRKCALAALTYPERSCLICAEPFRPHHRTQTACSPACKAEAHRRRQRVARRLERPCATCGRPFAVTSSSRQAFCSVDCRTASHRVQQNERPCMICGTPFVADRRTWLCSDACRAESRRRGQNAYAARQREAEGPPLAEPA